MSKLCEDRIAIVTGAGRGIGREHALMLAEHGAKVIVNDLGGDAAGMGEDISPAQGVVEEIRAMGGEAEVNGADVSDFDEAKNLIHQAIDTYGGLDILINNAGILRDRMIFSITEDDFDSVVKVHLKGTYTTLHHASKYWRECSKAGKTNDARVINTSSPSGIYGNIGQTNYGAAKAGIAAMSVIAAMELFKYGVTVNCLAPGALTRLTQDIFGGGEMTEENKESMAPHWIASLAVWLSSPEASGVTGRVFDVNGNTIGIAEGWIRGPSGEHDGDPAKLKPLIADLMSKAQLNTDMSGAEIEGPGRPARTI